MKNNLEMFIDKIKSAQLNDTVEKAFSFYYNQVLEGATGMLTEQEIEPPAETLIVDYETLEDREEVPFEKLVVIKLNGGLGTSMGLSKAKSLLNVKDDMSFLDVIVKQILNLREKTGKEIPLLLMNSFNTQKDTLSYLEKYPQLPLDGLPVDFLQNKYPKVIREDLTPLNNKIDAKNWNPPGHGEVYSVLLTSGTLDKLLDRGYQYAFISNSDNLGAVSNSRILSYMDENNIPFMMEVCLRTEMDKKGGHLAQTSDGQLILRESAQCPEDEVNLFQDINRYKYFNTNNLWVDLKILKQYLNDNDNFLTLPIILNKKVVDDVPVYQIEAAMGAAINTFKGAMAINVPRSRFVPVKKTNELLAIWSDAYEFDHDFNIRLVTGLTKSPQIDLDECYKTIDDMSKRFKIVPSLKNCSKLNISGDFTFAENVVFKGDCSIKTKENKELSDILIDNDNVIF